MMLASSWSRLFLPSSSVISQSDQSSRAPVRSPKGKKQSLYVTEPISRRSREEMRETEKEVCICSHPWGSIKKLLMPSLILSLYEKICVGDGFALLLWFHEWKRHKFISSFEWVYFMDKHRKQFVKRLISIKDMRQYRSHDNSIIGVISTSFILLR